MTRKEWTRLEEAQVAAWAREGVPNEESARRLGRTPLSVTGKLWELRVIRRAVRRYTRHEDRIIRALHNRGAFSSQIAATLERSGSSVRNRIRHLGLTPKKGGAHPEVIRHNHRVHALLAGWPGARGPLEARVLCQIRDTPGITARQIAGALGRNVRPVQVVLARLRAEGTIRAEGTHTHRHYLKEKS